MRVVHHTAEPDILIPAEGTYPYVRGGVSSWIAQLIIGLPQYKFGITFIGSKREEYPAKPLYDFPDNLVYMAELFIFDEEHKPAVDAVDGDVKTFDYIEKLYTWFKDKKTASPFPQEIKSLDFYLNRMDESSFLYSREAWYFISNKYRENSPNSSFIDYFWTVRSIHLPIWKMAKFAKLIGDKGTIVHSPSTGYAGLLATLISYDKNKPFILTEHGIYTKERKIDIISSSLSAYKKLELFRESSEEEYTQKMWVRFFEGIGKMIYNRADHILSLFSVARDTQILYGADANRCRVIPNGVDIETLEATRKHRPSTIPQIITLIGRVVSIKDIKSFIRAIRITVDKIPDAEAWIVGPDNEDKEYARECRELISVLDLEDKIKFLGFQNIVDILPKSGILTLTSISEGMPLVILEGFAAGLPCVSTDVGSCRELIYGGEDPEDQALGSAGKVCQIANVTQLADGYIEFLTDKEKWENAQEVAIKRVNKFYAQDMFLDKYKEIYEDVLEGIK